MAIGITIMLVIAQFPVWLWERWAFIFYGLGLLLLLSVLLFGVGAKGAQRWLYIGSFSFQPSELCKPFFIVFNAWILSLWVQKPNFPGWLWSLGATVLMSVLLLLQPDIGMTIVMIFTWGFQLFIT